MKIIFLSIRMGISMLSSGNSETEDSKLREEMEIYNQQVNGRFFVDQFLGRKRPFTQ